MSSITTQFQDNVREACIRGWGAVQRTKSGASQVLTRARDQRGQTAAEYMGLLLLIALVIFALISTTNVDEFIAKRIKQLVTDVSKGEDPTNDPDPLG